MKLSLIKKEKERITFEINGELASYVNTLRRIFSWEVPTMAISSVEFKQNTSALYDEVIAHRLGLLILKTDLETYNLPKVGAEKSAATHVTFTLKAKGPKTIYASDLKSSDPGIKLIHPEAIIAKLFDNQELELLATANLGFGKDHVKFSPGLVHYYYKPKITVNNKHKDLAKYLDAYPKQIISKGTIDVSKINTPQLIDACRDINDEIINVEYQDPHKEFIFVIESWGQLSPEKIVDQGIKQYNLQLDEFKKLLKDI